MSRAGRRPASSAQASDAFRAGHGRAPEGVWSAPGRVNVIGDHTDYHEGFALPFALRQRITVAAARRPDRQLVLARMRASGRPGPALRLSIDELAPGRGTGWATYPAGTAWALRRHGLPIAGADLMISGGVPTGAGLASSHAVLCATALALLGLAGVDPDGGDPLDRVTLAQIVQRVENDFVGAPTGMLDQMASLCCTPGHALLLDARSLACRQEPMHLRAAGLRLMIIDTRVRHSHARSGYAARRRDSLRAARLLGVRTLRDVDNGDLPAASATLPDELVPLVQHVVTENARVLRVVELLRGGRIAEIGGLLTASHASLRDDYRVSCPELDIAVATALRAGALGGRLTGGGFGGCAVALAHAADTAAVAEAVREAFAERALPAPSVLQAEPSAGARRDV